MWQGKEKEYIVKIEEAILSRSFNFFSKEIPGQVSLAESQTR